MPLGMKLCTHTEGKQTKKKTLRLIKWLQKKHLLKKKLRCPVCHHKMKMISVVKKDQFMWCCKRASHRKVSRTIRTGSLFEKSKSSLFSWMKFIYRFSQGLRLRQIDMIDDDVAGSSKTLSAMAKRIRQVCISAMERHGVNKGHCLGGHKEFVVMDESCLRHQRKYARGRFGNAWKRKKWVFGLMGVKDKRRRLVLKLVEKRTRRHLVPLIRQHVKSGSANISDEWRAYKNVLTNMGYKHYTVNHSRWFVDPHSGSHTQHIERAWMTIKGHIRRLRGNRTEMLLEEHLKVLEWSSWLGSKHPDGPLGRLFKDIWKSFPV
ncbi:uncharacterized protein [Nothobranchius furzeri]|uniref:uncharacterized protein n=1 Tax=Nothobranchius furzeri TaxID=105023 RepID=UPI002404274C|nr:uncharacterized protein LOC129160802 isoform X1 [Nothobranchius furzeri]